MNKRSLICFLFAFGLGLIALLISWALVFESSPFYQDSLYPGWARWIWQILNIPAVAAIFVTGTAATGILVVFFQWFLVGFFFVRLTDRIRNLLAGNHR